MWSRVVTICFVCSISLCVAFGGGRASKDIQSAKPIIDDGIERQSESGQGRYIDGLDNPLILTWYPVDSMANAFGPANNGVRPISYDPATNTVALIHRGGSPYAAGSGQLWYNISRDAGLTWRRVGELNGGSAITCRYPSGTIINPANSSDTTQCLFSYVAPNLENSGAFGFFTYGADYLGAGTPFGTVDLANNMGSSSATVWGRRSSTSIMWATTGATATVGANHSRIWRTSDNYGTVITEFPPTWRDTLPYMINGIGYLGGGMSSGTDHYFGMWGLFGGDDSANAYNGGYSKSTNSGQTWSDWVRPRPDWQQASGLPYPPLYDLYDYIQPAGGTVSWDGDMIVDGNGRVHFFHVIVDSPWTTNDPRHILEVYETAPNAWAYKWVKQNLNTYTVLGYRGISTAYLNQTNQAVHTSISPDGQVIALVWLDAGTAAPADTMPDIWFSYRRINGSAWSTPENLTQTPNFAELLLHSALTLKSNGGNSYTMFLGRSYQSGITTYPPDNGVKTTFFVAAHTFTVATVSVDEMGQPGTFRLEQNYPNPFNPNTRIAYEIPERSQVNLAVHNLLGQQVASLVDEFKEAGRYESDFSGAGLASGVYFYTIKAGQLSATKKLMLIK